MTARTPNIGEPAPWFAARTSQNPRYQFDSVAGRYVVLSFFGSAGEAGGRRVWDDFVAKRRAFDEDKARFFGVSVDPGDERQKRVADTLPGMRVFWDHDGAVSRMYGAAVGPPNRAPGDSYRRFTLVLDERLRVVAHIPIDPHPEQHVALVMKALASLPALDAATAGVPAPVLIVPRVFEPELCATLMRYYDERGGSDSGFMREENGMTVGAQDPKHKSRRDRALDDEKLRNACTARIYERIRPEMLKAFQFNATRVERSIVACYDAESGGMFRAHRDNTTPATAHRRFAVSIVLNEGQFEGGGLRFPEFGRTLYRPPTGGALVFSCSLLHEATLVTKGKRYVFLPFLYDDAAAQIREQNARFLAPKRMAG